MNTEMEKISYIIGRQIGSDFKKQGIDINFDTFSNGIETAFKGEESTLSKEESDEVMTIFQTKMQAAAENIQKEMGDKNLTEGKAYLEANKNKDGVEVTASGLQFLRVTNGSGKTPTAENQVEVHYEGTLIDGTVFDSSYQRNESITFPVNGVIPGWTEALQLMKEGDVWNLTIPSEIAYGERGAGQMIGPNTVLNFKVELIKVL